VNQNRTDNTMATRYQRDNQNPLIKEEHSRILIIPLVSCGHCVVCSTLIHGFWLSLWYRVAIVLSFLFWLTDSDYPFSIGVIFITLRIPVYISIWFKGIQAVRIEFFNTIKKLMWRICWCLFNVTYLIDIFLLWE
jgi:hypothetical protein